jgi:hypothetical protein
MVTVTPPTIRVVEKYKISPGTTPLISMSTQSHPSTLPNIPNSATTTSSISSHSSEKTSLQRKLRNARGSIRRAKQTIKGLRAKTKVTSRELRRTRKTLASMNVTGEAIYFNVCCCL